MKVPLFIYIVRGKFMMHNQDEKMSFKEWFLTSTKQFFLVNYHVHLQRFLKCLLKKYLIS